MSKPIDLQYSYIKKTGYTEQQRQTFKKLELLKVNVNQFIRAAVKEKLERDWKALIPKEDKYAYAKKLFNYNTNYLKERKWKNT
jgi:hypothetical protein